MKNKRGLSLVITTLIIILLVLVAIGIIWVVIRGIIEGGVEQVGISTKCLDIDVRATAVDCAGGDCNVTLTRKSGGEDIAGVKLIFSEAGGETNFVHPVPGNIATLASKTETDISTGLTTPNKIEVAVYFEDDSGNEQLCTIITKFSF